jgi:hypothetical protein
MMATQMERFVALMTAGNAPEQVMAELRIDIRAFRTLRRAAISASKLPATTPNILTVKEQIVAERERRKAGIFLRESDKPIYRLVWEKRKVMAPTQVMAELGITRDRYKTALTYAQQKLGPIPGLTARRGRPKNSPHPNQHTIKSSDRRSGADPWAALGNDAFGNRHFRKAAE